MSESKLEVVELSKTFPARRGDVEALDRASLRLASNEFVTLVGTSGCGKSTLLSIVAGLQEASSGEVLVDGRPVEGPGRDRGVVFQSYTLFPWLTARQNVEFALRGEGLPPARRRELAIEHLALVGLERFAEAHPNELSGGMKQRVAIARALSYRPDILLMDEPFGALDALTRQLMQELLTEIWEQHRLTVLFVTHDVEEAVYISDRVLVMTNRPGRIKKEVTVDLPRPRHYDMLGSAQFGQRYGEVLESIREESLQAGEVGSPA
ncbi:MAG: ABC transporter ATP-binding protein [Pseudonocardiaceae bacterium]